MTCTIRFAVRERLTHFVKLKLFASWTTVNLPLYVLCLNLHVLAAFKDFIDPILTCKFFRCIL